MKTVHGRVVACVHQQAVKFPIVVGYQFHENDPSKKVAVWQMEVVKEVDSDKCLCLPSLKEASDQSCQFHIPLLYSTLHIPLPHPQ